MPGTKRTTKSISYNENDDDDDDFVSKVDNIKKPRNTKTNDRQIESKPSTRPPPRKRNEKLSKTEREELDLALKLSKEPSIEIPIISDDKQSTTSQSTVSSNESQITVEKEKDEQDENSLPKSKRMKRGEEEEEEEEEDDDDDDDEKESNNEEEEEEEEEEIDEEVIPEKKPVRKTEETKKNKEIPIVTSIDLNSTRSMTRGQQKSSIPASEPSKKKSNVPIGFPTSKIIIPSLQASRVGLSRKSSAIKPLHPNLNQRIVHE